jgi:N-acetylmuramoyl-L-alanine amidase
MPAAWARPARVLSAWDQAVAQRDALEARAVGTRSRAEFGRVLDGFRAVYHGDPADSHAPEAVKAVAEVLAEQGRELGDAASLKAAVGQYEFLRQQYPTSSLRAGALLAEARIEQTDLKDSEAARAKYAEVVKESPRSEAGAAARTELAEMRSAPAESPGIAAGRTVMDPIHREDAAMDGAPAPLRPGETPLAPASVVSLETAAPVPGKVRNMPLAQVTGIRHWSTSSYTRVAIDLGDEVTFEAVRVPNPDRIYFDLHGAKLAPELVGKSFDVTDDGFLKKIRAAQFSGDMTRVVLDVNDVTEYSAFLLPNPYRLIIDIHGAGTGTSAGRGVATAKSPARVPVEEVAEAPVAPAAARRASAAANSSGLPATAPTSLDADGAVVGWTPPPASAGVPRTGATGRESARASLDSPPIPTKPDRMRNPDPVVAPAPKSVPAPRTGAVARSTSARPVPNTVATRAPETANELAALSGAPNKVEASRAPSTKPIAATVSTLKDTKETTDSKDSKDSRTEASRDGVKDVYLGSTPRRGRVATSSTSDGSPAPVKAADKTADGETSLVRALGLKIGRIVIDAGHGGHDSGTLGADGIEEKDVVLDVALRLGKLLHERLGAEIIYTRSDDTFIPLETRTAIANKAQADLFLSIHANSSQDETARGVETYYLNFTSDPTALDVAARENAVSGQSIHQLSDLVKKITLKDKIAESREFASDVEGSLYAGLQKGNDGLKNRGVKKAPFVVLIGANMPSILAEISFVTNPRDAEQLRRPEYRERVAESLYAGVARYEKGLGQKVDIAPVVRAAAQ